MLETPAEALAAAEGRIFIARAPDMGVTVEEVVRTARDRGWGSAIGEASVRPDACPPHFTVTFVEVEVDTLTGFVRVVRAVQGADVGTAVNLSSVEGQVAGGLHMGLGFALLEDTCFDERGKVVNAGFRDYKVLLAQDMPEVATVLADTYEPTGPFGAKGIGEGATNPVAAAVTNAIYNAVGVRITDLPATMEKIFTALKEKGAAHQ
jgi:xanthine dehydrogenase molybdenum-binding subunit